MSVFSLLILLVLIYLRKK
ncbi:MAG: GlyGly-CTERM sorting domain-containing protein [Candidatus Dadabacteria bacterium]|nr:GlyGly-CTERM sorting domain-containing protein [Candidatus Dadabacteria bacterium]